MPEICPQLFHMHGTPLLHRITAPHLIRAIAPIIKLTLQMPVVQRCPLQPGSQDDLLMVPCSTLSCLFLCGSHSSSPGPRAAMVAG